LGISAILVTLLHPKITLEDLGLIPDFINSEDPTPIIDQLDRNYAHGGGWHPMVNFKLGPNNSLHYPGDPVLYPIAKLEVAGHEEIVYVYDHAIVAVVWPDGEFDVSRMD